MEKINLDLKKFPMISGAALGASINCGPAAVEGEARRLNIKPTQLPSARRLFSFEQAELIVRSILKRGGARVRK